MNLNFLYFTDFKNYITPLSSDQYLCKDLIIQFINNVLYMKICILYYIYLILQYANIFK